MKLVRIASRLLLLLLGMIFTIPVFAADTYDVDWPALEAAVTVYLRHPALPSAQKVIALLPAGKRVSREARDFDAAAADRIYAQLGHLAPLVFRARPGALDVAWALREISDGAFSEELQEMIGKSLPRHPRSFLAALKRNRPRRDDYVACAVADNLGSDLVDNYPAQRTEIQARIAALGSVTDTALRPERDCVLKSLRAVPRP